MSQVPSAGRKRFVVQPAESAVLVEARSTAGRISFGTQAVTGFLEVGEYDGLLIPGSDPQAELDVDLRTLRSGNSLYDAELAQRLDVRRYPYARVALERATGAGDRFQVCGPVTLHGQTRVISGSVSARTEGSGWLIQGEHVFDIRDFEITVPSVLMLRIFPDVRIFLTLALQPASEPASRRMKEL